MSRDLRWYLSRLRAMSVAEVAHRSYRAARYPLDQIRMRTGLYARPSAAMRAHLARWQGPEPFYFDRELVKTPVLPELREEAESICAGKRRVLGLGWIDFPEHGWHYEPNAKEYWPQVDAARVVRSAPAHFDPRLTWEFNRGHEWVVLARVYAATRESRFLDHLVRELASWRQSNPLGIGINWTSAMEAAIRIHSLVWCAGFLRGDAAMLLNLAEQIYEHARFVLDHRSYFSSANNHLIVELSALVVAALAIGSELRRLHAPALARLLSELDRQIYQDGVNAEMATHYHAFVLEALVLVAYLQRAHAKRSAQLEAVIQRMADYLGAIRCGDGSLLQQGDNDDGRILPFFCFDHVDQLHSTATNLTRPAHARHARSQVHSEGTFGTTGHATSMTRDAPPTHTRWFANSGQFVLHSSRLHASFDAGPFGLAPLAAHAHCDALSLLLAVDGHRVLVDRGTYRYNGSGHDRDHYRLTAAHNTAQIGALEQGEATGGFLWSRHPTVTVQRCSIMQEGDIVQASHDGFRGWRHGRTLVHHAGVLAIIDEFHGTTKAATAISRYHFAPELTLHLLSRSRFSASRGDAPLVWLFSNAASGRVTSRPHSDIYAEKTAAPTLELLLDIRCNTLVTAFVPAHIPYAPAIERLARFATLNGVPLSARELIA